MSDAESKRRQKNTDPGQRVPHLEMHKPRPPRPPQFKAILDLDEDLPELRPRRPRVSAPASSTRAEPRLVLGGKLDSPRSQMSMPLSETAADLDRAKMIGVRPTPLRSIVPAAEHRRSILEIFSGNTWLVLLVGAACLVIFLVASKPGKVTFSNYGGWGGAQPAENIAIAQSLPGEHSVIGPPTISAEDVEAVLREYNSPAVGSGQSWIDMGEKYGIDPAYALAFFIHESSAGTNPGWAGLKPGGGSTHNVGNIICAGYASCFGRFRDYASWDEGIEDWYKLISKEYIGGRAVQTVEQIIPIYAPAFENNVNAYVDAVVQMVEGWRRDGVSR
jgi:hypothetical protein